ncbi:hypothetical protein [Bradyrhizobium icense]|uniref:Uncharacterized protein n=1 Tax=Bradyrhizobium icense TaxID=1274631 RepID=A0A1B1U9F8_9BRAD|nr:hypothetical protein [Bradyrhizobium icense]ANV99350.1 hypothetical protein LMTR13_03315 [Bradyrhizobium icense]
MNVSRVSARLGLISLGLGILLSFANLALLYFGFQKSSLDVTALRLEIQKTEPTFFVQYYLISTSNPFFEAPNTNNPLLTAQTVLNKDGKFHFVDVAQLQASDKAAAAWFLYFSRTRGRDVRNVKVVFHVFENSAGPYFDDWEKRAARPNDANEEDRKYKVVVVEVGAPKLDEGFRIPIAKAVFVNDQIPFQFEGTLAVPQKLLYTDSFDNEVKEFNVRRMLDGAIQNRLFHFYTRA